MITIKQFMETVDYRIAEGSDFGWTCYGPNAYTLTSWNGDQNGWSVNMVFDTQTQTVYEVDSCDYVNKRAYRLINPDFKQANAKEAESRGCVPQEAWDDVSYVDLETDEDWLEKASAIVQGQDYDTRVQVPVDFSDEELLKYMKLAHEQDITFNQFVEQAIKALINQHQAEL